MGSVSVYRDVKGVSTYDLICDELPETMSRAVAWGTRSTEHHGNGSSIFWAAVRDTRNPDKVWALCVLYLRRTETETRHGEFWHKDMDESMGPCYFDVPDHVWAALTDTGDEGEIARTWKAKVAAIKAVGAVRRRPRDGEVVEFDHATWRGYDGVTCWRFLGRSIFRPIDPETGSEGSSVRLRGWTSSSYRIVGPALDGSPHQGSLV